MDKMAELHTTFVTTLFLFPFSLAAATGRAEGEEDVRQHYKVKSSML